MQTDQNMLDTATMRVPGLLAEPGASIDRGATIEAPAAPATAVGAAQPLRDAIRPIARSGSCRVTDGAGRDVGWLTDWDVRRALAHGLTLDVPAGDVLSAAGAARPAAPTANWRGRYRSRARRSAAAPVAVQPSSGRMAVVLAGGAGVRLRPYTLTRPKPLVDVGGQPLLDYSMWRLAAEGFSQVYVSLNHGAASICEHFGDGRRFGLRIDYLVEDVPLGTAGPLALLPRPDRPFLVMNADLLTTVPFGRILEFHQRARAAVTVGVAEHEVQIPFGVVRLQDAGVAAIVEKPCHRVFVNAGVYAFEPDVLELIPPRTPLEMPALLLAVVAAGRHAAAFPIHEYWRDVGDADSLQRARLDVASVAGLQSGPVRRTP